MSKKKPISKEDLQAELEEARKKWFALQDRLDALNDDEEGKKEREGIEIELSSTEQIATALNDQLIAMEEQSPAGCVCGESI